MHTYIHSFIPSFLPFIHSFIHSLIHSFIQSYIHTYIYIYNIQMQEKHKVSCERFGFYRMVHAIDEIRHGNVEYCNACHGKFGNISFAHETYAASTQTPKCVFQFSRWKKNVFGTYLCWPAVPRTATNKEHANVYAFVSRNKSIHVGELIFPSSLQLYFINSHLPPSRNLQQGNVLVFSRGVVRLCYFQVCATVKDMTSTCHAAELSRWCLYEPFVPNSARKNVFTGGSTITNTRILGQQSDLGMNASKRQKRSTTLVLVVVVPVFQHQI